jgi:DNA-directed RNA polymerase subunit RPC12/RpoP
MEMKRAIHEYLSMGVKEEDFWFERPNNELLKSCPKCKFKIKKDASNVKKQKYSTPDEDWRKLRGRRGYIYICPKCGTHVGFKWDLVS